jgi:small neutral amino acid transporter SnatA (MarC family)
MWLMHQQQQQQQQQQEQEQQQQQQQQRIPFSPFAAPDPFSPQRNPFSGPLRCDG